jgi:hypothetical protein
MHGNPAKMIAMKMTSTNVGRVAAFSAAAKLVATTERLGSDRIVHRLQAEARWRALVEPVTKLKACLDRVLNVNAWRAGEVTEADIAIGRKAGFLCSEAPSGTGVDADVFAAWIVGPFRDRAKPAEHQRRLSRVPSWSAIGWRRRRHRADDAAAAHRTRALLDDDTAAGSDGSGRWLRPLPLVICAEGKHRAEMHVEFFDDMLVNLDIDPLPEAKRMRLRHVFGASGVLALQHRGEHGRWDTALLPFPEMSRPLFVALGAGAPRGWWIALPWSKSVQSIARAATRPHSNATPLSLVVRPSTLRTTMLESGYV